jgi:hypothetical protein
LIKERCKQARRFAFVGWAALPLTPIILRHVGRPRVQRRHEQTIDLFMVGLNAWAADMARHSSFRV